MAFQISSDVFIWPSSPRHNPPATTNLSDLLTPANLGLSSVCKCSHVLLFMIDGEFGFHLATVMHAHVCVCVIVLYLGHIMVQ